MKILLVFFISLTSVVLAQDVVQVICSQSSIVARIQKQVVKMANYKMENVHMNDRNCVFDEEDDEFYTKEISPLTECGTHFKTNATHVEFTNSISTVQTGPTFPYGVVVGSQANKKVLSALISCTYRIDLNVSTMFIPNISLTVIQMPDAFGAGEFRAAMSLYTDATYRVPYMSPPVMDPDATLYVGTYLVDTPSEDVYLLMEECWGTISNDPSATPKYPLIANGCPLQSSADGLVKVTQNGINHQGLWNSPVFKFVGDGDEFDNVWLHCNLQICINQPCVPTCDSKRKRRSMDSSRNSPGSLDHPQIISFGPVTRVRITQINKNETKTTYVDIDQPPMPEIFKKHYHRNSHPAKASFWNATSLTVAGILGGLLLLCVILGLVAIIIRSRSQSENADNSENFAFSGTVNKAYA